MIFGWRGEVEGASTFLASAVDEASVFTSKKGRSDDDELLRVSFRLTESKRTSIAFIKAERTGRRRYHYRSGSRVPGAKSHDKLIIHLHHLLQSSNLATVSVFHSSVILCINNIIMADSKGNPMGIFALPNEVSRVLSYSTLASAQTD